MYDLRAELTKLDVGDTFRIERNERQSSMATLRKAVADIEKRCLIFLRIEMEDETCVIRRVMFEKDKIMARKPKGSIAPEARLKTSVGAMLTPEQIAQGGSEHAHQSALMQWVTMTWKHPLRHLLFAVPNGGDRQAHVGASMRAEGVKKGVPDLCWPVVKQCGTNNAHSSVAQDGIEWPVWAGLWIEMKVLGKVTAKNGGCSDEQMKWHADLIEQGYFVAVAYGWQAAAWVLELYARSELSLPVDGKSGRSTPLIAKPCDSAPNPPFADGQGNLQG